MGTLWASADTQTRFRRNRESIAARLSYPLYDVNEAGTSTLISVAARALIDTVITTIWSVPGGIASALVHSITLLNTSTTTAQAVTIYCIEPGQTAASVARTIYADTIEPNETVVIEIPITLAASAVVRAIASPTSNVVSARVDAMTLADVPAGLVLKVIEGISLTGSLATLYTCPGIQEAVLLSAILCNTDTVERTPDMHIIQSAGSATVTNKVFQEPLQTKVSAFIDTPFILASGDFIQAKGSVTSVISARLSVLECNNS